jgi:hypothetical protein
MKPRLKHTNEQKKRGFLGLAQIFLRARVFRQQSTCPLILPVSQANRHLPFELRMG